MTFVTVDSAFTRSSHTLPNGQYTSFHTGELYRVEAAEDCTIRVTLVSESHPKKGWSCRIPASDVQRVLPDWDVARARQTPKAK